jgi:hypothetical protein
MMEKVQKPVILCVIHHRQNPLESTETLVAVSYAVGLEVNAEKAKYILMSRYQNAGQNPNIKTVYRSFEN